MEADVAMRNSEVNKLLEELRKLVRRFEAGDRSSS